ncbi:hypothetical protein KEJ34_06755 [Candidatus Bathyarchaeota archaeon]|nr:hypothetical protein [Candidatus Bathyarchaeota archaeon]
MVGNECLKKSIAIMFLALSLTIFPTLLQTICFPNMHYREQGHLSSNPSLFSNGISYLNYDMLKAFLGGDIFMNTGNFTILFEKYFIPANIRLIGLSVGWEEHSNTTFSDIPYYRWVEDFLSMTDKYGINVFFHFGSWKPSTKLPSWWDDVAKARPELRSSFRNGTIIAQGNPLIIDSPLILKQLKEDLMQLYQYYGEHASWVGIAFGRPGQSCTYVPLNRTLVDWGFEEFTLYNFFNSIYYLRDVNSTGYHTDGTKDKIWEIFMENQPIIQLKSGNLQRWGWSSPIDVYGGRNGSCIAIKFKSPEKLEGFQVLLYGYREGKPENLVLELYEDENDFPKNLGEPLENVYQPTFSITTSQRWQTPAIFTSQLLENSYYWILITAEGNTSNKYWIYKGDYRVDNETHVKHTTNGYDGRWEGYGSAFIIIRDLSGRNVFVRPFRETYNRIILSGQVAKQPFVAPSNITVNAIWLYLADRAMANDPRPLPITLIRTSDDTVMAKGELGTSFTQGTYWWSVIPLDKRVNLTSGEQYEIRIGPAAKECVLWQLLAEKVDPAEYGFQGKQDYFLFALADMDIDPFLMSYPLSTPIGLLKDPITSNNWMAIGFTPSRTGKLQNFSIKIVKIGSPSDLRISLYDDDSTPSTWYGLSKPRHEIESLTIPASEIPLDGWLQTAGWTVQLNASSRYWIVLAQISASEGEYRVYSKGPNYILPFVSSTNSGMNWRWGFPYTNTPGEPLVKISTTEETIVNEPWEIKGFRFKSTAWIAQSFILDSKTTIRGVNIWLSQASDSYEEVTLEIRTDEYDTPSDMILGKAVFKPGDGLYSASSLAVADFGFSIELQPGKYWIVIKSVKGATPIVLWENPAYGFGGSNCKAKVTIDGGSSWILPEGREGDLVFSLVKSPSNLRYTMSEIAEDIEAYHAYDINKEPLRGWNVYLNVQVSRIQKELIQWFESYTGRRWFCIDSNPPRIIQEVQGEQELFSILEINNFIIENKTFILDKEKIIERFLKFPSMTIIPHLTLTYDSLKLFEIYCNKIMPLVPSPIVLLDIDNIDLLEHFKNFTMSDFLNMSKRMIYTGDFFGKEKKAINILFIGNESLLMLVRHLMSTANVTFVNFNEDHNLTRFNDFKSFDVIVCGTDRRSMELMTQSAQRRIKEFLINGGGIMILNSWAEWADAIVGFSYIDEKVTTSPIGYVNYGHPILKPYSNITELTLFLQKNRVVPVSTMILYVAKDMNDQPLISINAYGSGLCIFYGLPIFKIVSTYTTILNNAIFYAAKKQERLPVLWYEDSIEKTRGEGSLVFSLTGKPDGVLLLWIVNNGPATILNIHLNAPFYGLDSDMWIAFDARNWLPIARGQGSEVNIRIEALNTSWYAIYIMNDAKEFHTLYSNVLIRSEQVYPNQAICNIYTIPTQEAWLVIRSPKAVNTVIVDDHEIERTYSISSISTSRKMEQWFYDNDYKLLYIRVKGNGQQKLRVLFQTTNQAFYEENLQVIIIIMTLFAILVELVVIKIRKQQKGKTLRYHYVRTKTVVLNHHD